MWYGRLGDAFQQHRLERCSLLGTAARDTQLESSFHGVNLGEARCYGMHGL